MSELILPFKPFTLGELAVITRCRVKLLETWTRSILLPKRGDEGTSGWDVMQAFGIFVGWRFLSEGASHDRAASVALYLGTLPEKTLRQNLDAEYDFPVIKGRHGTLVPAPTHLRLGKELNLTKLLGEFKTNLAKVFPSSPSTN